MAKPLSSSHIPVEQPPPYDVPDRIRELESNVVTLRNLVDTLQPRPPPTRCEYRFLKHLDAPASENFDDPKWIKEVLQEPGKVEVDRFCYQTHPPLSDSSVEDVQPVKQASSCDVQLLSSTSETSTNAVKALKDFLYISLLLTYSDSAHHKEILRHDIQSHQAWLRLHKLQSRLTTLFFPVDGFRMFPYAWSYFEAADSRSMRTLTLAIIEPCRVLGVSPRVALLMLRMFPYVAKPCPFLRFIGRREQVSAFWYTCPHAFAAKLCYDEHYLVDIVAPDLASAGALKEMIRRMASTFFVTLRSWSEFELNPIGQRRAKFARKPFDTLGEEDWLRRLWMRRALKRLRKEAAVEHQSHLPVWCRNLFGARSRRNERTGLCYILRNGLESAEHEHERS
ncbi:hypothetical protein BU16DRAFT_554002 [Lophium mytilinum]|uniref:Uncharacterized protein n=1 Tax=Lophium mytilinum TaxID=390894 RepID=A0A6A6RC30_9PEZI|nr:hypothetical protein BU16DRAFT_554002 [Lophium mytilinum]